MNIDITENLYQKRGFIWDEGQSVFYGLLNADNRMILDKNYSMMESFTLFYPQYQDFKIISNKGNIGYNLIKDNIRISGDVLNSFKNVFKKYIKDSSNGIKFKGGDEEWSSIFIENRKLLSKYKCVVKQIKFKGVCIDISEKANLYFHLTTTIGNVMPCLYGANTSFGKGLDIVYNKLNKYIENKDGKFDNWIKHVCGDEKTDNWLSIFVRDYYLRDFVEIDEKTKVIIPKKTLSSEKLSVEDGSWDNFFFETSKAIIARSYRVLNGIKEEFSDKDLEDIKKSFNTLCAEYEVKERW